MVVLPILPELFVITIFLSLIVLGVFLQEPFATRMTIRLGAAALIIAAVIGLLSFGQEGGVYFHQHLIVDDFGRFGKIVLLIISAMAMLLCVGDLRHVQSERFEFGLLCLFSIAGMLLMVQANSLLSVYIAIELQSLPFYVMAAFRRDSAQSAEAGLKYFILGSLASGFLLFGMSLVFGLTGSIYFGDIQAALANDASVSTGLMVAILFVIAGLAFKMSAAPFHMWTPDVYEGASLGVVSFFAAAPKIAIGCLVLRVLMTPFFPTMELWQEILAILAIISVTIGAFGAIAQTDLKRLLAYSSIGHMGYVLIGVAAATQMGVSSVLFYLILYAVASIGIFSVLLSVRRAGVAVKSVDDLKGLSAHSPFLAFSMAAFMLSMAGIPFLAGFFGKYYLFLSAVDAGLIVLVIIGILASVAAAYYYLRIIKVMFFDEGVMGFDRGTDTEVRLLTLICAAFTVFLFLSPDGLLVMAQQAAASLVP